MDDHSRAGRTIGGALNAIPGYRGYRDKEDRRDADRRVREHVATAYGAVTDRVERIARDLATQRRLRDVGPVDELTRAIRHLIDRISTATYGYGGLFSDRDVDAHGLDQLRQFDESLLDGVRELEGPVADLERAYADGADLTAPARAGTTVARAINARFDLRQEVIETGKPAPEESVRRVLSSEPAPTSHPAFDIHDQDAVSILGDDSVVDARIDVKAVDQSFRLFRLGGSDPERWLFVPSAAGGALAVVSPVDEPYVADAESTIGGTPYTSQSSGSGSGDLIGTGGESGERSVNFTLLAGKTEPSARAVIIDWGNELQVLVGKEVHPDDVEIFGTSAGPR